MSVDFNIRGEPLKILERVSSKLDCARRVSLAYSLAVYEKLWEYADVDGTISIMVGNKLKRFALLPDADEPQINVFTGEGEEDLESNLDDWKE